MKKGNINNSCTIELSEKISLKTCFGNNSYLKVKVTKEEYQKDKT